MKNYYKSFVTIGLMSGTSLDGIDATIIDTNGISLKRYNINNTSNYSPKTKCLITKALSDPKNFHLSKSKMLQLNEFVTRDHAKCVKEILIKTNLSPSLIGFHGQTIFHDPMHKISIQAGDGQLLSKLLNINVVSSFREHDLKHKGEGAPIAPIFHKFLIDDLNISLPTCFLNIGGVSNITFWDGKILIGFDTGPGNALIDLFMKKKFNKPYDNFGKRALKGKPSDFFINLFLKDPFFGLNYPKSLDNQHFKKIFYSIYNSNLSNVDCISTLSELTSISIVKAINQLPKKPENLIISGGGVNNAFILKSLQHHLTCRLIKASEKNLPSKMIEAELIAFLAARRMNKLPITFPNTTGVSRPLLGGSIFKNGLLN